MSDPQPHGPPVPDHEQLYRAILYPHHWNVVQQRPSSAAFDDAVFSVDIAARTTPDETRRRFRIVLKLVEFNCGLARGIGFDTRDERDALYPNNLAHAHVYFLGYSGLGRGQRKTKARLLADQCALVPTP
jgi:hypothetical protein